MPNYSYKALGLEGKYKKGNCIAEDEKELAMLLREKEFYLLKCRKKMTFLQIKFIHKIKLQDISILCNQLSVILKAGVSVSEALDILVKQSTNKRLSESLNAIGKSIEQGNELSEALREQYILYPKFMINMIEVGEYSGKLDYILDELSKYYMKEQKIKNKVVKAASYPIFVLLTTVCVLWFLIVNIIPIFVSTLESLGGKLPAITRFLLLISSFLNKNSAVILILALALLFVFMILGKHKMLRQEIDKMKFKIPIISRIYKYIVIIRFSKSMNILLSSGSTVIRSLYIVKDMFDNNYINKLFRVCIDDLNAGTGFGESILNTRIFTPLACSMILIGEETGNLDQMLEKISDIHTDDLYTFIEISSNFIEPIMIIVISFIVGLVILSVVLPMLNIMDAIN